MATATNGHAASGSRIRNWARHWLGITEAVDLDAAYVDPRDAYRDAFSGELWAPLGASGKPDEERTGFTSERDYAEARRVCRMLARRSAYAIGAHEARISYVVGTGHKYAVVAKRGEEVSEDAIAAVQSVLDEWCYRVRWYSRQQEVVRRRDRDGEVFVRKFIDSAGAPIIRFVEPDQVTQPNSRPVSPGLSMGIETDPNDVETVLAYWVDGERVEVDDIQHRKGNVDCNVRRGIPLMWPVVTTLSRARDLNRNMATGSAIQTSIAYVRRLAGGLTRSSGEAIRAEKATFTRTNSVTNRTEYLEEQRGGRILTVSEQMEYDFPFASARYDQYVAVVQSNLREVASMLQMPEFMLTADASNANYSSTLVAEGPAVKNFERLQRDQENDDLRLLWWVLGTYADRGAFPAALLDVVEIQVTMPQIVSRDRAKESQVAQILMQGGILSPQTASARFDLDYQQEQANIEAHREQVEGASGVEPAGDGEANVDTTALGTDTETVQDTALNGAQASAMIDIVTKASTGEIGKDVAAALLAAAFPALSPAQIAAIVNPIEVKEPPPPRPVPPAFAGNQDMDVDSDSAT